jgi:hypothetical protein
MQEQTKPRKTPAAAKNTWFNIDKEGLRKLVEHRSKAFAIFELLQNAWDEATSNVAVTLEPIPKKRGRARLTVADDSPDGFADLSHAYTLFAESSKKHDVRKRGRYNLGEKLVLALCDEATVSSTRGTVQFGADGRRVASRKRRENGTAIEATIRMTQAEYELACADVRRLLPPSNMETMFNGERLSAPEPLRTISAALPTVVGDKEGVLRPTMRTATVEIYAMMEIPAEDESAGYLYEMGIPVVELDVPFRVNVGQKIPLNADRDNVTPSYMRRICSLVLDAMHEQLSPEQSSMGWVAKALEDRDIAPATVKSVLTKRFGERIATYDPSDPLSNAQAVAGGYAVLHGGQFSKAAWTNIRATGSAPSAGSIFPTARSEQQSEETPQPGSCPTCGRPFEQFTIAVGGGDDDKASLGGAQETLPQRKSSRGPAALRRLLSVPVEC